MNEDQELKYLKKRMAELEKKQVPGKAAYEAWLAQQQAQQLAPPVPPDTPPKEFYATIPKKTAAVEVMKHLKNMRTMGLVSIGGLFITLLIGTFNKWGMYLAAGATIIPIAYYLAMGNKELVRIKSEYKL